MSSPGIKGDSSKVGFIVVGCFVLCFLCGAVSPKVVIYAKSPEYSHVLEIHGHSCLQEEFSTVANPLSLMLCYCPYLQGVPHKVFRDCLR